MPHGQQWFWLLGIFGALCALIIVGIVTGDRDDTAGGSPPSSAVVAKPRVGATGCTAQQSLDTTDDLLKASEGIDAIGNPLTVAASRKYAPAIVSLQNVRDVLADADVPDCGDSIRREILAALDAEIDGFTRLSEGGTDAEVATQFELVTEHMNRADALIKTINP